MASASFFLHVLTVAAAAQELPAAAAVPAPQFEVHEWGVFPVPRNDAWAMRDLLSEWATFPEFFHGRLPERGMLYRGPVTKPVIWIHTEEEFRLSVEVRFEPGRPLIWWPPTEYPATGTWEEGTPDLLRWSVGVNRPYALFGGEEPVPEDSWPEFEQVPEDHWIAALRQVECAELFANGSFNRLALEQYSRESFLYYDGLMPAPPSPTVERTENGWAVSSNWEYAAEDLRVIERGAAGVSISARWTNVKAGEQRTELAARKLEGSSEEIAATLDEMLRDLAVRLHFEGLGDGEARALIEVWRDGLVQQDGISVFYRVPQSTYDTWLPLRINPEPRRIVRVGIVLHRHLEPELEARVRALVEQLSGNEAEAATAAEELARLGGAAFPWLEEAMQGEGPAAARARAIFESLDVLEFVESMGDE